MACCPVAEIKNFEVHESLNYIFISISYEVAKYAWVMSCGFARDYAHHAEGQLATHRRPSMPKRISLKNEADCVKTRISRLSWIPFGELVC
jgi:hypothetical protein